MEVGNKPTHGPRDGTPTDTVEDHDTEDESNTHPSRTLVSRPVVTIGSYEGRETLAKTSELRGS